MKVTDKAKREIAELYSDKKNKVQTIAELYGIHRNDVSKIAAEMGCEPRLVRGTAYKTCTKCRRKIELRGVKYCPYCANDLRSERDILIERVQRIHGSIMTMPQGERDKVRDTVNAVLTYLRKEGKA